MFHFQYSLNFKTNNSLLANNVLRRLKLALMESNIITFKVNKDIKDNEIYLSILYNANKKKIKTLEKKLVDLSSEDIHNLD